MTEVFIVYVLIFLFFLAYFLFRLFVASIPSVLLFSPVILLGIDWKSYLVYSFLLFSLLSFFSTYKLLSETVRTQFCIIKSSYKYKEIISKYMLSGEVYQVSIPLLYKNGQYQVVRYYKHDYSHISFKRGEARLNKPLGIIVLKSGRVVSDEIVIAGVLRVYSLWYYYYMNPMMGKKPINKYTIEHLLKFNKRHIKHIRKNQLSGYKKTMKKYGKKSVDVLTTLDNQVLEQEPMLKKKVESQLKLINSLFLIFEKPSDELFLEIESVYEDLKKAAASENGVWSRRISTWKKLKVVLDSHAMNIKPNFKLGFKGIIAIFIEYKFFNSNPVLGLLINYVLEIFKLPLRWFVLLYNDIFVYHFMGIDAIKKNISDNKILKTYLEDFRYRKNSLDISLNRVELIES